MNQITSGDFVIWRGKKYKVRGVMNGKVCIETQNKPLFSDRGGPPEAYAYKCKWLPISRVHGARLPVRITSRRKATPRALQVREGTEKRGLTEVVIVVQ